MDVPRAMLQSPGTPCSITARTTGPRLERTTARPGGRFLTRVIMFLERLRREHPADPDDGRIRRMRRERLERGAAPGTRNPGRDGRPGAPTRAPPKPDWRLVRRSGSAGRPVGLRPRWSPSESGRSRHITTAMTIGPPSVWPSPPEPSASDYSHCSWGLGPRDCPRLHPVGTGRKLGCS